MPTPFVRDVYLRGELAEAFGAHHRLAVETPAEAVRALEANRPGFQDHLRTSADRGIAYRVLIGDEQIDETQLLHPLGSRSLELVPEIQGAGGDNGGPLMLILGVALIAVSFFLGPAGAGTFGLGVDILGGAAFYIGAVGMSLALTGVSQMIAPSSSFSGVGDDEREDNRKSAAFSGPVNTTSQGVPVPVGYGELLVGSATISLGVRSIDEA